MPCLPFCPRLAWQHGMRSLISPHMGEDGLSCCTSMLPRELLPPSSLPLSCLRCFRHYLGGVELPPYLCFYLLTKLFGRSGKGMAMHQCDSGRLHGNSLPSYQEDYLFKKHAGRKEALENSEADRAGALSHFLHLHTYPSSIFFLSISTLPAFCTPIPCNGG